MHAILGSCQPQQPLLLWERGRYTNNRSKEYTYKKWKGLWAYTIHKTSIILLTKTMTWLCIPILSPMLLMNRYLSAMERSTKRVGQTVGDLCITPTICVFVVTSHCLLHMMNKRDRQTANIKTSNQNGSQLVANEAEVKDRETTCRMAFAFSMIAATFKFLVLVLAGDLIAVCWAGATGFKLKVCSESETENKLWRMHRYLSFSFVSQWRTRFICQPCFLSVLATCFSR